MNASTHRAPALTVGAGAARRTGVLLALLLVAAAGCSREETPDGAAGARPAADGAPAGHVHEQGTSYRCPMHPEVVSDAPGECPICGMDLVEVAPAAATGPAPAAAGEPAYYRHPHDPSRTSPVPRKDEMGMDYVPVFADAAGPEVRISPAVINNLGVRTAAVSRDAPQRRALTTGYVALDERRMQRVQPRAEGWIEGLSVRAIGETVRKGQRLFTLYSPMLESAQQEYLDALRIGNRDLIDASAERLGALGLDAGAARQLARDGRASGRVPFHAPIAGVVTEFEVREGAMVSPQMTAMTITELDSLWVIAEVPEAQAAWVSEGTAAEIRLPSLPGETIAGRVEYVYPELDTETRTLRARIVLDGMRPGLRPNMLANVALLGAAGAPELMVPRAALIRSGTEERVVVALGEGRFAARRVVAGPESGDRVVIREGLAEGEEVVVAGQFLLDSEANLRAGLERLAGGAEGESPADAPAGGDGDAHRH